MLDKKTSYIMLIAYYAPSVSYSGRIEVVEMASPSPAVLRIVNVPERKP